MMKKVIFCAMMMATMLCFHACTDPEEEINNNGHEYVDLGLSVKWAACNVGATTPEGFGDYFAWGETTPKATYSKENSVLYTDSTIGNIGGNASYDAATANWGGDWRLPTMKEMQEMSDNCTVEWTTRNGVNGCLFTSEKNGQSIFLPAAGRYEDSTLVYFGERGRYWSDTPYPDKEHYRYSVSFGFAGDSLYLLGNVRYFGLTVRPVIE